MKKRSLLEIDFKLKKPNHQVRCFFSYPGEAMRGDESDFTNLLLLPSGFIKYEIRHSLGVGYQWDGNVEQMSNDHFNVGNDGRPLSFLVSPVQSTRWET